MNGNRYLYYQPIFGDTKKEDYKKRCELNAFTNYGKVYQNKDIILKDLKVLQSMRKEQHDKFSPNVSKRELRLLKMFWAYKRTEAKAVNL